MMQPRRTLATTPSSKTDFGLSSTSRSRWIPRDGFNRNWVDRRSEEDRHSGEEGHLGVVDF